jgi:hypothetical protein
LVVRWRRRSSSSLARYGFLYCATCKEGVLLGKWLRDDDGGGVGFWHGRLCPEGIADSPALGRKVLRFLARHMDHDLLTASDEGGRADAIIEAGDYRDADDEYDEGAMRSDA